MKRGGGNRGFSLIEVVIIIVIIGAAFSGLTVVLSNTTTQNMNLDLATEAVFLAREKMSEVKAKNFADVVDVAPTNFGGDFARYNFQVAVDYVNPTDLNTPVAGPTSYKRIAVTVSGVGWTGNVVLSDLKTDI